MKISRIIAAVAAVGLAGVANAGSIPFTSTGAGTNYTATLVTVDAPTGGYSYSLLGVLGAAGNNQSSITSGSPGTQRYDAANNAGGELSVGQIAAQWAKLVGANLTFTRIFDNGPVSGVTTPNIRTGVNLATATDQVWSDGTVDIAFIGAYAFGTQYIGTSNLARTSSRSVALKSSVGSSFVDPSTFASSLPTGASPSSPNFIFTRTDVSTNGGLPGTRLGASNGNDSDSVDNFISFAVTGIPGVNVAYALFAEDGVDADFNDAAILFSGSAGATVPVPVPTAVLMGGAALGLLGVRRARRA